MLSTTSSSASPSPSASGRGRPLGAKLPPHGTAPCFYGLALVHMWVYCSTHRPSPSDEVSIMAVMYLVLSACLAALFLALRPSADEPSGGTGFVRALARHRALAACDLVCLTSMGASGLMLAAPLGALPPVVSVVVSSALGGLGMGWLYARWCGLYARLAIHVAAPLVFLTMAVGSLGKTVIDLMPGVPAAAVLACLPALSILCLRRSHALLDRRRGDEGAGGMPERPRPETAPEPAVFYNRRTVGSLVRIALGVAVYSLAIGVIQSMLLETTTVGVTAVLVHHLGEVAIALAVVVWVSVLHRGLDFCGTWRLISVLIATALIFEPFIDSPADPYLLSLVRTAQTFLIVFLFLALADIARHSRYHPFAVFAAGWASYALPFALGKMLGDALVSAGSGAGTGAGPTMVVSGSVWALVVVMLFVLDQSSLGNRLVFSELNDEADQDTLARRVAQTQREMAEQDDSNHAHADALATSCDALAAECGLTPREREILELLARGRTKAHIAEAFFISENTVRNHVKHIYAKLDVHDRQELIDAVEAVGRA